MGILEMYLKKTVEIQDNYIVDIIYEIEGVITVQDYNRIYYKNNSLINTLGLKNVGVFYCKGLKNYVNIQNNTFNNCITR